VEIKTSLSLPQVRRQASQALGHDVVVQNFGASGIFLVKTHVLSPVQQESLKKSWGHQVEYRRFESIGPKIGKEMVVGGLWAVTLALLAVFVYIASRFHWRFSLCASVALIHDCLVLLAIFLLTRTELNEGAFVSLLITAAYSINDTVVIFDRIRENQRKKTFSTFAALIQGSIHETLSRTILTSLTTVLALLVLYVLGGPVISVFSWPILAGVVVGTYSSLFLAAPMLTLFSRGRG